MTRNLLSTNFLERNPDENQRNGGNTSPLPNDVVEFPLVIAHTRTHLGLKGFHGENLNTNVDMFSDKEGQVFDKQIIGDERVFPELNLYSVDMFSGKTSVSS